MPKIPDVVDGELIESSWGNQSIRDRTVQRMDNVADRDASIPSPGAGETVWIADVKVLQIWDGTAWTTVFLPLAGGSMSGDIDMGGHSIINNGIHDFDMQTPGNLSPIPVGSLYEVGPRITIPAGAAVVVTFHASFTVSVGTATVDFAIGIADTSGGAVKADMFLSDKQGNSGLTGDSSGELSISYAFDGPATYATYLQKTSDVGTQLCDVTTRSTMRVR